MKTRVKLTAPAIRSRIEAEALTREIASLILQRNQESIDLDTHITNLRAKYEESLASLQKQIEEKTEVARAWAEANPSEFRGLKSLEMTHAVIGWRTGQPTLKTLAGWTWDRVLEKLQSLGGRWLTYVRTRAEVDKRVLLADRESFQPEDLRAIGLRVVQDESFFIEPKLQELENRQTAAS